MDICRRYLSYTPSDDIYLEKLQEILLSDPNTGLRTEPDVVLSHVIVGNQRNAESLRLLRKFGVTHVLNVAGYRGPRSEPDFSPYEGLGIGYMEIKAQDRDDYDITTHFSQAFAFLDKVKREGGLALVHCAQGINRSVAVCLGYLMITKGWTLLRAAQLLKRKRNVLLGNPGFRMQLVRFARKNGLLDEIEPKANTENNDHESNRARKDRELATRSSLCRSEPSTREYTYRSGAYSSDRNETSSDTGGACGGDSIFERYLRRNIHH